MSFHQAPYFQHIENIPKIAAALTLGVAVYEELKKVFKCDRERDWILNIRIM